jgi:uncharacterized membrane protein
MVGVVFFSIKYIFRTLHMISFALIFGNACYDIYFGKRFPKLQGATLALNIISSLVLIISGLINMILLIVEKKYEKDSSYQLWKRILIGKFFLTLLLTPLLDKSFNLLNLDVENVPNVRFSLMTLMFLVSPFLRFYREYYLLPTKPSNVKSQ